MLLYYTLDDFSNLHPPKVMEALEHFKQGNTWPDKEEWLRDTSPGLEWKDRDRANPFGRKTPNFDSNERWADDAIMRIGSYQDESCHSMKDALLQLEDVPGSGRVPLASFYGARPIAGWYFNEPPEFMRLQNVLDESDPDDPKVIIPNYVYARNNCIAPSGLFSVCCFDQCNALPARLEEQVAAPTAKPDRLLRLVSHLSSDTRAAPRNMSALLRSRLEDIAARHGGEVPLHGRLVAQWMHLAFPGECLYPHTPDSKPISAAFAEWMEEAPGRSAVNVTEFAGFEDTTHDFYSDARHDDCVVSFEPVGLPWKESEALVTDMPVEAFSATRKGHLGRLLRCMAFAAALLSLAASVRQRFQSGRTGSGLLPMRDGGNKPKLCFGRRLI